ncbi:MAG: beta-galactosidase [Sedimentisphaerales bacterium]|nr:beta-galactosidase [Sedimentisphaerales bacterium]
MKALKHMFFYLISILLFTAITYGETYQIDSSSAAKEILPGNFNMGTTTNPDGAAITSNNYHFIKADKPWLPVMGEMHYARYDDSLWDDEIKKMKAGGIDIVATYCFWIHHEEIEGEFDFTGRRNLKRFVEICKENDMYVWLRIGPWCNGECRNGGFPDWIRTKGIRTRSNDPGYLKYVRILYQRYYDEVKGMLYKDGGPIIGIQLENECNGPEYILELKKIAREAGFDVPFYTVTGWNNVRIPENEVLPVQAGYPDDFWSAGTNRNRPNEQFLFMLGIPINTGVGEDVLPVLEAHGVRTYNTSNYPLLMAELGLGMQWTNRRRPVIDERDAGALMLVKLAGGANCLGYYMYHGGSNPEGKLTPLGATGGFPVVSYDYQGAIDEFGQMPKKYHVLKLAHYFLQDFGYDLAPMIPAMPSKRPSSVMDADTFRCMVRTDNDSGYLFFNNYQRYVENKDLDNIQVQVKLKNDSVTIPSKPVTIPKNTFGIWPVNLNMNGAILEYATAQTFAHFTSKEIDTYFFFAHEGIPSEFVFKSSTISDIKAGDSVNKDSNRISILVTNPGIKSIITVHPKSGKEFQICILPREQALHAARHELWGQTRLVVTDGADTIANRGDLDILSTGKANGSVWIYPAADNIQMTGKTLNGKAEGIFRRFDWSVDKKDVAVELKQTTTGNNPKYEITVPSDALDGVYDVYLDVAHVCDYMAAKLGDHLIGDWYYIGQDYRPSLLNWGKQVLGKTISFELTPLTKQTQCFIEDKFRPDFSVKQAYAQISSITAIPMYRITFSTISDNVQEEKTINLSGNWAFQLDPEDKGITEQWYSKQLQDKIKLPGSLQEQGYGEKPSAKTKWTTGIGTQLLNDPRFAEYIKSEDFKCPFWLTPDRYYVGAAWYQKQIKIPDDWTGKRIVLFLERPHWQTTVWVDNQKAGMRETLGTPHEFDLTDMCKAGREHLISIRVDNNMVVPVGMDAHSVSDQTQSNWNGITGKIALSATPEVWLDNVQIFPDISKKQIKVELKLGNNTGKAGSGQITIRAVGKNSSIKHITDTQTVPVSWSEQGEQITFNHPMGQDCLLWDEFSPALYQLEIKLTGEGLENEQTVTFGMREIGIRDKQFTINNKKIFLRGTLECCIFPEHGYPPTEVSEWKRIIGIAKSYGLNHFRFHSWCPPEAAFIAADETGFYLQPEGSCWAAFGDGTPLDEWIYKEVDSMIENYGSHPSFCFFSPSNEPSGRNREKFLGTLLESLKIKDNRRLYVAGAGWPQIKENQYSIESIVRLHNYNQLGLNRSPQTFGDYRDIVNVRPGPVVGHEIGQWCVYPDVSEENQYTGVLKAKNMAIFRDKLNKAGMGELAHDFLMASGKFQALIYKQEIETALRTPGFAGFQQLSLHDFPGQGTAPVGILNALWKNKGYITPEQYRRFCNQAVPLARMKKLVFTSDESFNAIIEIANYGAENLKNVTIEWVLSKNSPLSADSFASGQIPVETIPTEGLTRVGDINIPLNTITEAAKLNLEVRIKGTDYANDWEIWVYPAKVNTEESQNVVATQDINEALKQLQDGRRVLLIYNRQPQRVLRGQRGQAGQRAQTVGSFAPIFWNRITFPTNTIHTLGILCRPEHPALTFFPTDFHSNWQWQDLLDHSTPLIMDKLPAKMTALVQPIDDWNDCRRLGLILEASVGKGKLLICAIDIQSDLENRITARQLRHSLMTYMHSEKFTPQFELSPEQIQDLCQ